MSRANAPAGCYHVGLSKDGNRLIVEARRCVDFLSCELWQYLGIRKTTKKQLRANRKLILDETNKREGTKFSRVIID